MNGQGIGKWWGALTKQFSQGVPAHLWVAWSGWASRAVTALVGLLTIRVLLKGLGAENYAAYVVLGGVHSWCLMADFGFGASLQNHISEHRARKMSYSHLVAMTSVGCCVLFVLSLFILYFAAPPLSELLLWGFPQIVNIEKAEVFLLIGGLSVITALGGVTYNIWFAEQKGYLAHILPAMASFLGLLGVLAVSFSGLQDRLFWSVMAAYGPIAIFPVISFAWYLVRNVRFRDIIFEGWSALLARAAKFWVFALMSAGVLQIDYLLMSQFLPARDIVIYNLASKIFLLVFYLYSAVLTAVWPVFAELSASKDWVTIKSYLRRYLIWGALLVLIFTVTFFIFNKEVVQLLAPGEDIVIPELFILTLGVYFILRVWSDTYAVVLFSMSYLRPFFFYIPIQALLSFFLQWTLIPYLGVYGVVLGLIGSFALTALWVLPFSFYKNTNARVVSVEGPGGMS